MLARSVTSFILSGGRERPLPSLAGLTDDAGALVVLLTALLVVLAAAVLAA